MCILYVKLYISLHDLLKSQKITCNLPDVYVIFSFLCRTLLLIMRELIQTERDYVNALEYIIEVSHLRNKSSLNGYYDRLFIRFRRSLQNISCKCYCNIKADECLACFQNYIPELMREDIPQALRGQRNVIFGNIEKIYEFHSGYFLRALEACEMRPFSVGSIFLRYVSNL